MPGRRSRERGPWGYFAGQLKPLNAAVIFAASIDTTLAFSPVALAPRWQLATIILATAGLFCFGLSTSVMFILGQKAYDENPQ